MRACWSVIAVVLLGAALGVAQEEDFVVLLKPKAEGVMEVKFSMKGLVAGGEYIAGLGVPKDFSGTFTYKIELPASLPPGLTIERRKDYEEKDMERIEPSIRVLKSPEALVIRSSRAVPEFSLIFTIEGPVQEQLRQKNVKAHGFLTKKFDTVWYIIGHAVL